MKYCKLIFILFLLHCIKASAQQNLQNSLDSFSGKFVIDVRTQKQKAFLVTDKSVYYPGDNIWFNVFLLNTVSQKPSVRNKFLFVDLVNDKDSVVKVLVLDAGNKQLNARISLPDSIAQGYYWMRAYTREMADNDSSGVGVKSIYIVGKNSVASENNKEAGMKDTAAPLIKFYPEGGNIITGIASNIALLATDKQNNPITIDGIIKDSRNAVVAKFSTNKYGLAKFNFEPSGYRQYQAVVNWNGADRNYFLPAFNFYNGQLSVNKYSGGYNIRVLIGDSAYTKDYISYVIGVSRDSLFFAGIGKGLYELNIPDEKLPQGIATFYLLNKDFALLSERSVYADKTVQVSATTDKQLYDKRDKVSLSVAVTDLNNRIIPSQLSISVTDSAFAGATTCDSNFKQVNNISLAQNKCLTNEDIDLFMLTRTNTFYTSKVASKNLPLTFDSLLYVKGTVLTDKGSPVENKAATLILNTKSVMLFTDTTNAQGQFSFPIESYVDNSQFSLSITDFNGHTQNTKIVLDSIQFPKLVTPASKKEYLQLLMNNVKTYFDSSYKDVFNTGGSHQLTPVIVRHKKNITYDESKRVSGSSTVIPGDELQENTKLGDALFKVSGVHIVSGLLVIGSPTSMSQVFTEPLLLVDGYYVDFSSLGAPSETESTEPSPLLSYLSSINPKDVDFIEVLKGPEASNYGTRGGNGVIIINTLNRRREVTNASNDMKVFTEKGITNPALFMNTDYQQKNSKEPALPDDRSTLFWNGNFTTENTQAATINFYTADVAATYKITITGITANGDYIYKTTTFTVR